MAFELIWDFDSSWVRGTQSSMDPGSTPAGSAWHGINMIFVSGVPSCRPGHRCIVSLPEGNLQGCAIFRPKLGLEQLLVAIDGKIFVAEYPFNQFRLIDNVLMSPTAKQVFWQQCTQVVRRLDASFTSAIEIIPPKEVMMIQDGGNTAPAFYDGTLSGHIRDNPFETPAGGPMAWVGDRLFVAADNKVFASDITNPFSFREEIYLGGTSFFQFRSDVTAMSATPSVDNPQLAVFTENDLSIIQANIRNRDLWPVTDQMQREVLQVGCTSHRAVVSIYGLLAWYAPQGFVFFNPATAAQVTSRTPLRDNEMLVSKSRLHEDVSLASAAFYGSYLLMSLPAEDLYNKHTWVLNTSSYETLSDEGGPVWCGLWLGTRPVQWVYGVIAGAERIFHVSKDEDGTNRLWESFTPDRLDNGCPITWALFTRGHFGLTSQAQKLPGAPARFGYSDVALAGIEEDLDLGVFYAGGVRGAFKQIMAKRISVRRGSVSFDQPITATTQLFAFKAQSRVERTEDANQQSLNADTGACPVESFRNDNLDESFQLLVVGHGPATIRWIRSFAMLETDDPTGDSKACEDEVPFNAIRYDGVGLHSEDISTLAEDLAAVPQSFYTSNQTAVVEESGISAVGVGSAESIVSQRAADRVAERIAVRMAETEVAQSLPPVLSIGEGF